MTSGKAARWSTMLLACLPLPAACAAAELDELLARIARPPPARTAFVEWRESALLAAPQRVAGELEYRGPAALSRRVDSPWRETTRIDRDQVTVERDGERARRFALRRAPELRVLLAGFTALLGGDATALARDFEVTLAIDDEAWRITLVPRDAAVRRHFATLAVDGRGDAPQCFLSTATDGNRSLMRVGTAVDWVEAPDSDLSARIARCATGD